MGFHFGRTVGAESQTKSYQAPCCSHARVATLNILLSLPQVNFSCTDRAQGDLFSCEPLGRASTGLDVELLVADPRHIHD